MTTTFSFSESIMTPGKMQPCTPEMLNAAFDNQRVINTCREIANRLKEVKEGKLTRVAFKKVKTTLKEDNLPVFCFHATFSDGYRHNQSAIPSGLSIYDIDELTEDPRAYYINKVAGREEELGICLAHISPSYEGVRLVFEMPKGMSLAEAQRWMADQLGDKTYDGCVKDMARCSFGVCRDYVLYYNEEKLFAAREVEVPENPVTMGTKDSAVSAPLLLPAPADYEDNFNGISYPQIIKAVEDQLGGVPAQGARNNFIFAMACNMRYVCNDGGQRRECRPASKDATAPYQVHAPHHQERTRASAPLSSHGCIPCLGRSLQRCEVPLQRQCKG